MKFMFGNWKVLKDRKKLADKFGENTGMVARAVTYKEESRSEPSFPHLLNRLYVVPVYSHRIVADSRPLIRSFQITDAQREKLSKS